MSQITKGSIFLIPQQVISYFAKGRIARAFLEVVTATAVVKIISASKEIMVARFFGTSVGVDGFQLALSIVGAIQGIIGNAIRPVLLPLLIHTGNRSLASERRVVTLSAFLILLGAIGIALVLPHLFEWFRPWLFKDASPYTLYEAFRMIDILRWGLPFALLALWAGTILERYKRFILPTLMEAIPAICIILLLLIAVDFFRETALALGTLLGFLLAFTILFISAVHTGSVALKPNKVRVLEYKPSPTLVGRNTLLMLGGGVFVSLINMTDSIVASWQGEGAVAVLGYAQRVISVFLSLSAAAIARISLPYIAERFQESDVAGQHLLSKLIRAGFLFGVGLALPLAMFAQPITALVFEGGAFTAQDTQQVSSVLFAFTWQLPFYFANVVQVQALAAKGLYDRVLWISVLNTALNIILDILLARWLGVVGIAWAKSVVVANSMFMGFLMLRR